MIIYALSDQHGLLPEVPECDLLLIAGDLCPTDNHSLVFQENWLRKEYKAWLQSLPAKHIVGIAGNHDFLFEDAPGLVPNLPWTYLQDSATEVEGLKIWGTPWQNPFFDWAFNLEEDKQKLAFAQIPEDIDILLSHGPPFGWGDKNYRGERCGSKALLKTWERVQPQLTVFGHIHEDWGRWNTRAKSGKPLRLANVSLVDLGYDECHEPQRFSLDAVLDAAS